MTCGDIQSVSCGTGGSITALSCCPGAAFAGIIFAPFASFIEGHESIVGAGFSGFINRSGYQGPPPPGSGGGTGGIGGGGGTVGGVISGMGDANDLGTFTG